MGRRETEKRLARGECERVYVARDADPRVVADVIRLATDAGVEIVWADTMRELGRACGIDVGASVAGLPRASSGADTNVEEE